MMTRIAATLLVALALAACGPSATEREDVSALARAMALSSDESTAIVRELRAIAAAHATNGQRTYRGDDIPSRFRVLEPVALVVSGKSSRIELSDRGLDSVYLLLREHAADSDGTPHGELVIVKGKDKGRQVWWRD